MPLVELSRIELVTVDAYGTLVELVEPAESLRQALADLGVERSPAEVEQAFRAEVAYYRPRQLEAGTPEGLADLRRRCVALFLDELSAPVEAEAFLEAFLAAFRFRVVGGAADALAQLRTAGFELAVVANWDCDLARVLTGLGLAEWFTRIYASSLVGMEKPDPKLFAHVLDDMGVRPEQALHVGDSVVDEDGASAAGMAFLGAPLATVPERLGLRS